MRPKETEIVLSWGGQELTNPIVGFVILHIDDYVSYYVMKVDPPLRQVSDTLEDSVDHTKVRIVVIMVSL